MLTALYMGEIIKIGDQFTAFFDENKSAREYFKKKYNGDYYLYNESGFLGKFAGKLGEESGLGDCVINFEGANQYQIALSYKYNPYPRKVVTRRSNFGSDYLSVLAKTDDLLKNNTSIMEEKSIDLDNDGKTEHIVMAYCETTGGTACVLTDSSYNYVKCLYYFNFLNEAFPGDNKKYKSEVAFRGTLADADNDSVMENISFIPAYEEGFDSFCVKYQNGIYTGPSDIKGEPNP